MQGLAEERPVRSSNRCRCEGVVMNLEKSTPKGKKVDPLWQLSGR